MIFKHTALFSGMTPFPMDMLRRDQCHPSTEDAIEEIRRSQKDQGKNYVFCVTLTRFTGKPECPFNNAAWQSHGWSKQATEFVKGYQCELNGNKC